MGMQFTVRPNSKSTLSAGWLANMKIQLVVARWLSKSSEALTANTKLVHLVTYGSKYNKMKINPAPLSG